MSGTSAVGAGDEGIVRQHRFGRILAQVHSRTDSLVCQAPSTSSARSPTGNSKLFHRSDAVRVADQRGACSTTAFITDHQNTPYSAATVVTARARVASPACHFRAITA